MVIVKLLYLLFFFGFKYITKKKKEAVKLPSFVARGGIEPPFQE